jgi:hypothetical protein
VGIELSCSVFLVLTFNACTLDVIYVWLLDVVT